MPESKGGCGAYSIPSWIFRAVSAPNHSDATVRAKSIPAVTPPPVITLPSTTTRSATGSHPKAASIGSDIQWVVARLPRSSPAAPSTSAPVQTDVR